MPQASAGNTISNAAQFVPGVVDSAAILDTTIATADIANGAVTEAKQTLADNTTGDVSTTKHGYAPKAPNDATKFLNGQAAYAQPKDSDLATTDITTNDVSTSKHGFAPKAPNDATKFLRGDGTWADPGSATATYILSDTLKNSNNTVADTTSATYVKLREITLNETINAVRVKTIFYNVAGGTTSAIRIYKNDVAIGVEHTSTGATITSNEDFTNFVSGDKIQIYGHGNGTNTCELTNFEFHYDHEITAIGGSTLATPLLTTKVGSTTNSL